MKGIYPDETMIYRKDHLFSLFMVPIVLLRRNEANSYERERVCNTAECSELNSNTDKLEEIIYHFI